MKDSSPVKKLAKQKAEKAKYKSVAELMGTTRSPYARGKAPIYSSRQSRLGLGSTAEDRKLSRDALASKYSGALVSRK